MYLSVWNVILFTYVQFSDEVAAEPFTQIIHDRPSGDVNATSNATEFGPCDRKFTGFMQTPLDSADEKPKVVLTNLTATTFIVDGLGTLYVRGGVTHSRVQPKVLRKYLSKNWIAPS